MIKPPSDTITKIIDLMGAIMLVNGSQCTAVSRLIQCSAYYVIIMHYTCSSMKNLDDYSSVQVQYNCA